MKNRPGRSAAAMRFPGAPYVLKMACGENPKRVYGKKSGPSTRMGNVAQVRTAFLQAQDYLRKWAAWRRKNPSATPSTTTKPAPRASPPVTRRRCAT